MDIPWYDTVPPNWELHRLKTRLVRNDGGTWGEDDDPNGVVVLRSTEQTSDGKWRIHEPAKRLLSSRERQTCLLAEGDLVVTKSSGSAQHIGKTTLVDSQIAALDCCFSNFMQRLRFGDASDPRYYYYVLNSDIGREQLNYYSSTTTGLANLNAEVLGNLWAASPPLPEQRAIAAFLDRETARIDTLIEKKRRQIELLGKRQAGLVIGAVTKGIDNAARMRDSGVPWFGSVPTHWTERKLGYIVKASGGMTPSKANPGYWDGDLPWVSPKDMKVWDIADAIDHVTDLALRETSLRIVPIGSVLVVVRGMILAHTFPVGISRAPLVINQDMKALAPVRGILPDFLAYQLKGFSEALLARVDDAAHGTKCLRSEMWKSFRLFMPPEPEQRSIVSHIDKMSGSIRTAIGKVTDSIDRLERYRASLISLAVTGQIDILREAQS